MIRAPSALDTLLKKEAGTNDLPKKEANPLPKKEADKRIEKTPAQKIGSDFDAIVDNTVALFHQFKKRKVPPYIS